jgi:hypothetical protein
MFGIATSRRYIDVVGELVKDFQVGLKICEVFECSNMAHEFFGLP